MRVSDVDLQPVDCVRDLGVLIDSGVTLAKHVNYISGVCFFQLRQFRIIRRSLTADAAHALVRALIHTHIDYCNGLLVSCPRYLTDKLIQLYIESVGTNSYSLVNRDTRAFVAFPELLVKKSVVSGLESGASGSEEVSYELLSYGKHSLKCLLLPLLCIGNIGFMKCQCVTWSTSWTWSGTKKHVMEGYEHCWTRITKLREGKEMEIWPELAYGTQHLALVSVSFSVFVRWGVEGDINSVVPWLPSPKHFHWCWQLYYVGLHHDLTDYIWKEVQNNLIGFGSIYWWYPR